MKTQVAAALWIGIATSSVTSTVLAGAGGSGVQERVVAASNARVIADGTTRIEIRGKLVSQRGQILLQLASPLVLQADDDCNGEKLSSIVVGDGHKQISHLLNLPAVLNAAIACPRAGPVLIDVQLGPLLAKTNAEKALAGNSFSILGAWTCRNGTTSVAHGFFEDGSLVTDVKLAPNQGYQRAGHFRLEGTALSYSTLARRDTAQGQWQATTAGAKALRSTRVSYVERVSITDADYIQLIPQRVVNADGTDRVDQSKQAPTSCVRDNAALPLLQQIRSSVPVSLLTVGADAQYPSRPATAKSAETSATVLAKQAALDARERALTALRNADRSTPLCNSTVKSWSTFASNRDRMIETAEQSKAGTDAAWWVEMRKQYETALKNVAPCVR